MEGNPSSTQVEPVKFQGERSKFRPALDKFQRSRIKFQAELGATQSELDRFPLELDATRLELSATRLGKRPSQPRNRRKPPLFILLPFPPKRQRRGIVVASKPPMAQAPFRSDLIGWRFAGALRFGVGKRRLKIARRFNAGENAAGSKVPPGRLNGFHGNRFLSQGISAVLLSKTAVSTHHANPG